MAKLSGDISIDLFLAHATITHQFNFWLAGSKEKQRQWNSFEILQSMHTGELWDGGMGYSNSISWDWAASQA
jgi:hypothetical protein